MKTTIKLLSFGFILLFFDYGYSQIQTKTIPAAIQLIHNSADPSLKAMDVYLNGKLLLDDFYFRSASPLISAPANVPIRLDVAPYGSKSVDESIYSSTITLASERIYIIVANGDMITRKFTPLRLFKLYVFEKGEKFAGLKTTKVLFFNGAPDAPALGLLETGFPIGVLANTVAYGEYYGYMTLRRGDYQVSVYNASLLEARPGPGENNVIAAFSLPLETLKLNGQAITLISDGFLNREQNGDGPFFGLYVATAAGGPLIPLEQVALTVRNFEASGIVMYPNPASGFMNVTIPFSYNNVKAKILDLSGREIQQIGAIDKQVDISNLTNGMYLLNLEIDDQVYMQKFYVDNHK